jgi:hypothetical protein
LQGLGEIVGPCGMVVELWMKAVEYIAGNAAVEAVVDLIPLELGELIRVHFVGADDFHSDMR